MEAHKLTLYRVLHGSIYESLKSPPQVHNTPGGCSQVYSNPQLGSASSGGVSGLGSCGLEKQGQTLSRPYVLPKSGFSSGGWKDGGDRVSGSTLQTLGPKQGFQSELELIPTAAYSAVEQRPLSEILGSAGRKALGGGLPGMAAMGIQVASLMWLRTTVNYQYKYGTGTVDALKTLYKEGGVRRFYRGVGPALIQGPLSRFGDTAANAGTLALLDSYESTKDLPVAVKTLGASTAAACWRIFLMPVDTCKTILQVEGKNGLKVLGQKLGKSGPTVLYHGALAASSATLVGHYPWFFTYNYLNETLPQYEELPKRLLRSAFIGFCSSVVSDTSSNSIRVIKTTRQTSDVAMSYPEVVRTIYNKDGLLRGFLIRGLKTKIFTNGLQGILFSVLWRMGMDWYNKHQAAEDRVK